MLKRIKDKLIILGTGPSLTTDGFRCNDSSYEIWGLNNVYDTLTYRNLEIKADRWFEIHQIDKIKNTYFRRGVQFWGMGSVKKHLERLRDLDISIIAHRWIPIIPKSIPYPFMEVFDAFEYPYFTCTMCWQLALVILMKYKEVFLIGIDLMDYWERRYQKAAVEYWLGLAQGGGIKVRVSLESGLLKGPYLYGFERINRYE